MKRRSRLARALGLLAILAGGSAARPQSSSATAPPAGVVEVVLEPQTLAVGDPVVATLTLELSGEDAEREASFPDWSKGWGDAEVLSASPVDRTVSPQGVLLSQRLELTAFRPGTAALPPVEVRLGGAPELRAATPQNLSLEVRSVIAADDKELAPAPPAPPRPLAVPQSFWWTLAAGGALLAFAAILVWRRRAALDPLAAPELSPMAELDRDLGLLAGEPPETAFRLLSRSLRRYLGRKLDFHALESTTTEIQRKLAGARFEAALVQRTIKLLRLADQIKFALRPTQAPEVAARVEEGRALAAAIESHLAPREEVAADLARPPAPPPASGSGTAA